MCCNFLCESCFTHKVVNTFHLFVRMHGVCANFVFVFAFAWYWFDTSSLQLLCISMKKKSKLALLLSVAVVLMEQSGSVISQRSNSMVFSDSVGGWYLNCDCCCNCWGCCYSSTFWQFKVIKIINRTPIHTIASTVEIRTQTLHIENRNRWNWSSNQCMLPLVLL